MILNAMRLQAAGPIKLAKSRASMQDGSPFGCFFLLHPATKSSQSGFLFFDSFSFSSGRWRSAEGAEGQGAPEVVTAIYVNRRSPLAAGLRSSGL
jgi:hypothetical protein